MAVNGFLSGLGSGMQMATGLLDSLENRQRREQAAKRQALLFQQQQDDRIYDQTNLRPLRLQDARLGVLGKRDGLDYNRELRPLLLQDKRGQVEHNAATRPLLLDAARDNQQYRKEDRNYLLDYQRPRQKTLDERGDEAYTEDRNYLLNYTRPRQKTLDKRGDEAYTEDRNYLLNYTRPRQKTLDKRGDEAYTEDRNYLLNYTRPRQKTLDERGDQRHEYDFKSIKADDAHKWYERNEKLKKARSEQAVRNYQAALVAQQDGDLEAQLFYLDGANEDALPIAEALNGKLAEGVATAEQMASGQVDFFDPSAQQKVAPLLSNSMKASGRLDRGFQSGGLMPGPNGGAVPSVFDREGNLTPATRYMTNAPDDPIVELNEQQLRDVVQQQKNFNEHVQQNVSPEARKLYLNRPDKATASKKNKQRVVSYSNGEIRIGGSVSWRNRNPGNLEYGKFAKANGAIGTDGRFAIFPDDASGTRAQVNLLRGDAYADLSIKDAISKYAPSFENDTGRYINVVAKAAGVSPTTKIGSLNDGQFLKLTRAMRKHEGYKAGRVASRDALDDRMRRARYQGVADGVLSADPAKVERGKLPVGYQWVDKAKTKAERIPGTEKAEGGNTPGFYEKEQYKGLIQQRNEYTKLLSDPMLQDDQKIQLQQNIGALDQAINQMAGGNAPSSFPSKGAESQSAAVVRLRQIADSVPDAELPVFVSTMRQRGATDEQIQSLVGDRLAAAQQMQKKSVPRGNSRLNGLGAPTMDDFMTVIQ